MSEVIDCIHGVAQREEVIDKIHVSPAVFCKSVNDEEYGLWFGFREPALVIDPVIPYAVEKPFLVFHDPSSFRPSGRKP
jgi:hypothetical protein